jgi:hypothetical protein
MRGVLRWLRSLLAGVFHREGSGPLPLDLRSPRPPTETETAPEFAPAAAPAERTPTATGLALIQTTAPGADPRLLTDLSSAVVAPDRVKPSELATEQEPTVKPSRETTDVVIGLDFGTSCTKVVVRTPYIDRGWAVAVPFGDHAPRCVWLLPSLVRFDARGLAAFGSPVGDGRAWMESLKVRFLERHADPDVQVEVVSFLALVIRHSRAWFLRECGDILRGAEPRWQLNLGIPTTGYGDDVLRTAYYWVAAAAWHVALGDDPVGKEASSKALSAHALLADHSRIQVVPEVVAEAVGYAHSPQRKPGLHMLMDIGASTLDVGVFVLSRDREDGSDMYAMLEPEVGRYGTLELHRARVDAVGLVNCHPRILDLEPFDPFCRFPDSIIEYTEKGDPRRRDLEELDHVFKKTCERLVMRCLVPARQYGDPMSENWRTGLPVYLCGGGAGMDFYRGLVRSVNRQAMSMWPGVTDFQMRHLPRPFTLATDGLSEAVSQRLTVSYGLSFERFDIGRIYPPPEVDPIPPPRRRASSGYVSKDQV